MRPVSETRIGRPKISVGFVLLFFGLIFCSVSLLNHYNFRTYALDYGMFNQALHAFSAGENALFTQGLFGEEMFYLCDHFSPVIALLSPLKYITGTYSLLFVQIAFLLISAYFVFRISILKGIHESMALLLCVFSLSFWAVYGALSYDFHANVLLASLLPVIYYYHLINSNIKLFFSVVFALLCKENAGFVLAFFFIAISLEKELILKQRARCWLLSALSLGALAVTLLFLIPGQCGSHAQNAEGFYSAFGNSFPEAAKTILSSPFRVLKLFVFNFQGELAKAKMTTYWFLLLSGGMFVLLQPRFLILLFPILLQKFLSSNELLWDVNGHYSIEFVPLLALAAISVFAKGYFGKYGRAVIILSICLSFFVAWRGVISRNDRANIFSLRHYQSDFPRSEFYFLKDQIPENAVVSCSSHLSPHLSFRDKVFVFPIVKDAEYILLDKNAEFTYPITELEFMEKLEEMSMDSAFEKSYESAGFILFKKRYPQLQ